MSLKMKSKPSIGLDIGHYTIKLVMLDRSPQGWKVHTSLSALTPPNSVRDGSVVDVAAVAATIKGLLKRAGLKNAAAHVSVAGASVVMRNVRIPKMNEQTLRKSIRFEAGRYVPNSPEDSYIEFEILGDTEDGQMDVLIVAAPKQLVDSRLQACTMAGVEVESVNVELFAAFRALVEANQGIDIANDTIALIDIGAYTTQVSVIHKGNFAITRTINQGGNNLTDALQRYFKLTFEDAEEGKMQLDVRALLDDTKPTENPPLRVLQPQLDELIREMRRSLNFYQSQQTEAGAGGNLSWMLVSGGGAKLPGIADYMSGRLGLKVYPGCILDNPRFSGLSEEIATGPEVSVASGLAMRAHKAA